MLKPINYNQSSVYLFVFVFVCLSTYSYFQHLSYPLDGDFAESVLPIPSMFPLFEDPFGYKAIVEGKTYHNTNRFFGHYLYNIYFNYIPPFLQYFTDPLSSLYHASAISKILIQTCLIFICCFLIGFNFPKDQKYFWLSACLFWVFFQNAGEYYGQMAIIDKSITYTFFYALTSIFLFISLYPLILIWFGKPPRYHWAFHILWIGSLLVTVLSGPLNAPFIVLFCFLSFLFWYFRKIWKIKYLPFLIIPVILAVYSFYLGTYNATTIAEQIPLSQKYYLLNKGINQLINPGGIFIWLIFILICQMIFLSFHTKNKWQALEPYIFFFIFFILYIALLPFGGYRPYRMFLIRYDTIHPFTLGAMMLIIHFFIHQSSMLFTKQKIGYYSFFAYLIICLIWNNALIPKDNICEIKALREISNNPERIQIIDHDCPVMGWNKFTLDWESDYNSQFLIRMGVFKEQKLWIHKKGPNEKH